MTLGQKLIGVLALLLLIAAAGTGYYFFTKYQNTQKELQMVKTDPNTLQKAAQEEVKRLVAEVGKIIELPANEDPTVATITDIEKLKDQPFFKNAKNGDKVLIYTNSKKAILYDPIAHKVIDVAPVNIGSSSAQQTQQARIVLLNGTTSVGLTNKVEADIRQGFPQANISAKGNATKSDYEKTIVVALNDQAKDAAANLAKVINVSSADSLPAGENKPPNADIVILIGKDRTTPAVSSTTKP